MKTNIIISIVFTMIFANSCNNQQNLDIIIKGGETISDKPNLKKINKDGQNEINSFEYIVTEILTTSPRFRQLTKGLYSKTTIENEGLSYGINLEGSPNKKHDMTWSFSRSYDFSVYKISPVGKINTGYFSFNPMNKLLYEYDVTSGQLNAIEFDRDLLVKYNTLVSNSE